MSEPWVNLSHVPALADEAWLDAQREERQHEPESARSSTTLPVRIVDFASFVATEEPSAEPLLGTAHDTLLPMDGMLLMYGDGGAGKTTLTIDAVSHLASGEPWIGIPVERPVRTLLIENEGPRGKFRQRLAEKHASWNGHPPFHPNVRVLEEPWTRFTLRDREHQQTVAETVTNYEIDLVVMGPLVTLGMVGGGTPDEVGEFEFLLRETRSRIDRPVSFWIIHHENKAGDVSGAWERVPDALCHVQSQGNGHTRLVWKKARWADSYHSTSVDLIWTDGRSYLVKEQTDRDLHADIVEAFRADDAWRTVKEVMKLVGARHDATKDALADLVDRGELTFAKGPGGRSAQAHCYRLRSVPDGWEHPGTLRPLEGFGEGTVPLSHGSKGTGGLGTGTTETSSVPTVPGTVGANPLEDEA